MDCNVLYDIWQMECCGITFSVDDSVKWLVIKAGKLRTPVDVGRIDYYEAHDADVQALSVLEGSVASIRILYHEYAFTEGPPRMRIPVSGKPADAQEARGFDKDLDGMKASAYVVALKNCTLHPAEKKEVTYQ